MKNGKKFGRNFGYGGDNYDSFIVVYDQNNNEHLFTGIIYDCYENGNLANYYMVKNGIKNGEMVYFYPNGQVKEIKHIDNNTLEGIQKEFYENGVLKLDFATNGAAVINGKFTVNENGKYTVFAEDAKGNKAVQVIDVKKVNSAPIIKTVQTIDKFNVVDDSTNFVVQGTMSDSDGQSLLAKAKYNGITVLGTVENTVVFKATLKGTDYKKGYHQSTISIVANDGIVDSVPKTLTHTVIKVDKATDYMKDLKAHSENPDSYTEIQHEAFYKGYESIFTYEKERTKEALKKVNEQIEDLKLKTVKESETLISWQKRIDLVTASTATEVAEKSLSKTNFEHAKELVNALTDSEDKNKLVDRIDELQRYHDANEAIKTMESDHGSTSWDSIKRTR